ncbi:MAG: YeeE/YedE family protein [Phycisphaerae bacterium]|nr:YeeE/YedE family protein [Phycisphaerae bacterium]
MNFQLNGFLVGFFFGAALYLGGLADPDKIIGTLRLKDFHAMRTIAVFVLVGMLGTWILSLTGHAHYSVKPAALVSVSLGGALLGIGFGMTGFCPGTGLACAAAGRFDALVSILGMLLGAMTYIMLYSKLAVPIEKIANFGNVTLPEITHTSPALWVLPIVIAGGLILGLTAKKK